MMDDHISSELVSSPAAPKLLDVDCAEICLDFWVLFSRWKGTKQWPDHYLLTNIRSSSVIVVFMRAYA